MAAVEGAHITIATGKNLTIVRVIYKCGCFREKSFMISVNFGPFFKSLLVHRLTFMLAETERFFKLAVICKKSLRNSCCYLFAYKKEIELCISLGSCRCAVTKTQNRVPCYYNFSDYHK